MPTWIQLYKNHKIHEYIEVFRNNFNKIMEVVDANNEEMIYDVNRINKIVSYFADALNKSDPDLISADILNNCTTSINLINTELYAYHANSTVVNIANAVINAEMLLNYSTKLPVLITSKDKKSMSEFISDYYDSNIKLKTAFKEAAEKATDNLNNEMQLLKDAHTKLMTDLARLTIDFNKTKEGIETQKSRLDTAITTFVDQSTKNEEIRKEQFAKTQENYKQIHDNNISSNGIEFRSFMDSYKSEKDKTIISIESQTNDMITYINDKLKQATDIVKIIGGITLTGNYKNIAHSEGAKADLFQRIALFLFIAMVLVVALTVMLSNSNEFNWKLAIFRTSVAIMLAVPATYAAKESAKHRAYEQRNRTLELELATIDPYIESMPSQNKIEIKQKLTDRFFGAVENEKEYKEDTAHTKNILDILKLAIENLTKKSG